MHPRSIRNRVEPESLDTGKASAECNAITPKRALTEAEAARYIGMSAAWLKKSRTRRFRGVVDAPPFIRAGAKRVVYRVEDLHAWQDRHLEQVGPACDTLPDEVRVSG